jgi:lipopolysaccharide export LptBFGC system permease protein LptF
MSRQEIIDKYFGKAISKTFMVFIIATIALFTTKLTGSEWTIIAGVYIGTIKATETLLKLKDKF